MTRQRQSMFKIAASAALLMFSAGAAAPPALAQDGDNCHDWAKAFCASIGVPGNPQCIGYWTMRCEQGGGIGFRSLDSVYRPE